MRCLSLSLSRDQGEFWRRVNFRQSAHPRGSSEYIELESLNSYNLYLPHLFPFLLLMGPSEVGVSDDRFALSTDWKRPSPGSITDFKNTD